MGGMGDMGGEGGMGGEAGMGGEGSMTCQLRTPCGGGARGPARGCSNWCWLGSPSAHWSDRHATALTQLSCSRYEALVHPLPKQSIWRIAAGGGCAQTFCTLRRTGQAAQGLMCMVLLIRRLHGAPLSCMQSLLLAPQCYTVTARTAMML